MQEEQSSFQLSDRSFRSTTADLSERQDPSPNRLFEIKEEWHRIRPYQKVYKITIFMNQNMQTALYRLICKYSSEQAQKEYLTNLARKKQDHNSSQDKMIDQSQESRQSQSNSQQPHIGGQQGKSASSGKRRCLTGKLFNSFKYRGKHPHLKYCFNRQKQKITILIGCDFFLKELKNRERDILNVAKSFIKVWTEEYIATLKTYIKYEKDFENNGIVKFDIVEIDIISITFDISYYCLGTQMKRFRFRYSLYQFRYMPIYLQRGTDQTLSYVECPAANSGNSTHIINDKEYYISPRLAFLDEMNNNDLMRRVIMRFWVFYQIYNLNKGSNLPEYQYFNKKTLGRVHFHSIRMKKFQLIFPFYNIPEQNKSESSFPQKQEKVIYITFYIEDSNIIKNADGMELKMLVNLTEHQEFLTLQHKEEIFELLRLDQHTISMKKPGQPKEIFQFYMTFKFDERIGRRFSRIQTLISEFLDKVAFWRQDEIPEPSTAQALIAKKQDCKETTIQLCSEPIRYDQHKSQYQHSHSLHIKLKHQFSQNGQVPHYYPYRPITQTPGSHPALQPSHYAQHWISFSKLLKKKVKKNMKQNKQESVEEAQLQLHEDFEHYVNHLLATQPLRQGHMRIVEFVESVVKVCYNSFKDSISPSKDVRKESILTCIVRSICEMMDLSKNPYRRIDIQIMGPQHPYVPASTPKTTVPMQPTVFYSGEHTPGNLICEVTFSIKDLRVGWVNKFPIGYIVIRVLEGSTNARFRMEILKELVLKVIFQDESYDRSAQFGTELIECLHKVIKRDVATIFKNIIM